MRTVIYDAELMEPITVVDIPQHLFAKFEKGAFREIVFPILQRIVSPIRFDDTPLTHRVPPTCRVRFEPVRRNGAIAFWICVTDDGESALLLRSVFLPGQRKEVAEERGEAFLKGLGAALSAYSPK